MSFQKYDPEDLIRALEDISSDSKEMKLLKASNFWVNSGELEELVLPIYMSDEELAYLASVVYKFKTLGQQRALIDVMHVHCDENTLQRFISLFSNKALKAIMYNC